MEPLLCFPSPLPGELAAALDAARYAWKAVGSQAEAASLEPPDGWAGGVVYAGGDSSAAFSFCRALRPREAPLRPLLLVVEARQIAEVGTREDLFDDFVAMASVDTELAARLERLMWTAGRSTGANIVEHGPLVIDLETYQAAVAGKVLDLTYMEYELLRFLATRPGKVFTRETLLSRVWGYEYYGGARTVDVHVRRLRAKLGEEHAHLIQTVRSVGYRFAQPSRLAGGRPHERLSENANDAGTDR
jgi:two-component system alkaline phosphatase synthesis response regulator PhoP